MNPQSQSSHRPAPRPPGHPAPFANAAACILVLSAIISVAADEKPAGKRHQDEIVTPQPRAHAHNDYEHDRPLLDALDNGFCSVEADIFLVDGALLVAHERSSLVPGRTLEKLYLDPLRERANANGGRVFRDGPGFTLLIDIKSDGAATYRALAAVLGRYRDIVTEVRDGELTERAVTAVVSGNRALEIIVADDPRFVGVDGRLSDLGSDSPAHFMPLISDRWTSHFTWRGEGEIPDGERRKLREAVSTAHASGRRVRFWATPENRILWGELVAADVDLINTDDLTGLQEFLEEAAQR